ncbi:MAG: hypothetical protein DME33_06655 [Verrucomicrobia bacterium]|nr:MAG: hypothetical protein DME33_06655 [Verrucomicrobiota bacterium]
MTERNCRRTAARTRCFRWLGNLYGNLRIARDFGEHRLPACSRRQLADDRTGSQAGVSVSAEAFRQAAEKDRLAACAPQNAASRRDPFQRFNVSTNH